MSFIHSSLVQSLQFSAGGFQANYGDRLSSVLDITYKSPDSLESGGIVSLLGVEGYVGQRVNHRFNYLVGSRYRSNGYFLNSLPTKGAYNPVFMDAQFLGTYALNEKTDLVLLGHYSSNNFRF
ncbi:MAG: TonB-dependent receptor, partial [Crocinitomicaceae bacterium]